MSPWKVKANIIISELCRESYRQAQTLPNGRKRKRHKPYHVPPIAESLVEALGDNDEEKAKAIFLNLEYLKQI